MLLNYLKESRVLSFSLKVSEVDDVETWLGIPHIDRVKVVEFFLKTIDQGAWEEVYIDFVWSGVDTADV